MTDILHAAFARPVGAAAEIGPNEVNDYIYPPAVRQNFTKQIRKPLRSPFSQYMK